MKLTAGQQRECGQNFKSNESHQYLLGCSQRAKVNLYCWRPHQQYVRFLYIFEKFNLML